MDWLDVVILALRIVLVAILYLFLLLVMRVAVRGLVQPAAVEPRARPASVGLGLVVVEAGGSGLVSGQRIEVGDGTLLGRSSQADVVIADAAVSAEHARLMRVGRAWVVADLGSTNGTRVNDARVNGQTPVTHGDVLTLGNVRFKVLSR